VRDLGWVRRAGEEGRDREQRLLALVRGHGGRLIGPNCLGIAVSGPRLNATFGPRGIPAGNIGFSSQSGALGLAFLQEAAARGLGLSAFVLIGNKADVSSNDLLEHFEDDPATEVVLLYLESFGNPRRFGRLARRVARRKPILAMKSGRSRAGIRAAGSHTAALAGSEKAVDALFHQAADLDGARARDVVAQARDRGDDVWRSPPEVRTLLEAYGLPLVAERYVATEDEGLAAAHELGFPVVAKTTAPGVHKTERGGVALDLRGPDELRAALARVGLPSVVQPMVRGGAELLAGVVQDPVFGPLVAFGPGGVRAEIIGDAQIRRGRRARIRPPRGQPSAKTW